MTQDEIDDNSFFDDDDGSDVTCGRWDNARLLPLSRCRLAGTEECDWDCPYNRPQSASPSLQQVLAEALANLAAPLPVKGEE